MNNLLLLISFSLSLYLAFKFESSTRGAAYIGTFSLFIVVIYPFFFTAEEKNLLELFVGDSEKSYLSATSKLTTPLLILLLAFTRDFWVVVFETSIFFIMLKSLKA